MNAFPRNIVALLSLCVCATAHAGTWNTDEAGVVLDGYDVVAYHTMDRAVQGTQQFAGSYDGGTFYFANAANLQAFNAEPARYAPKFNAYCAFAAGHHNAKVPANADTFKLYNGELLVFFNNMHEGENVNTKVPWNGNERALYAKAVGNWRTLEGK